MSYTRPLIPLGLIGWVSGLSDRYMIAGILTAEDVGTYAAVYGLASRPMLMLSSIAETAIRPAYYSALGRKDPVSKRYLGAWFVIVFGGAVSVCLFLIYFHQYVSSLLLGPNFRGGSHLMPWIAAGYGLSALSHITTRVCYAYDKTERVLITETIGACLAVGVSLPLIYSVGLVGAAMAVPIYFGIQLALSAYLARRTVQGV